MYKCRDCERLFEEGEEIKMVETHGLEGPPYEVWYACPHCHSNDFEETEMCNECHSDEFSEDIYEGLCEDCAKNAITYELALEYIKETSSLAEFFLCFYYGTSDNVVEINSSLENELEKIYWAKIDADKQSYKNIFFDDVKEYIFDDLYNWAVFLKKRKEDKK